MFSNKMKLFTIYKYKKTLCLIHVFNCHTLLTPYFHWLEGNVGNLDSHIFKCLTDDHQVICVVQDIPKYGFQFIVEEINLGCIVGIGVFRYALCNYTSRSRRIDINHISRVQQLINIIGI